MKKLIKQLYCFADLSDEAKEKARAWFRDNNDMPFLKEFIEKYITEEIVKAGYAVEDLKVFYSLSYHQGDGVSFTATLEKSSKSYQVNKKNSYYEHELTIDAIEMTQDGEEKEADAVTEEMQKIARAAARQGYSYIANEQSDANVDETIEINEYTFTKDGERIDPD